MLSGCAAPAPRPSPSSAQAISVSIGACAPNSASTATTAAAALAALPPRPLDSGRPFLIVSATPRRSPSRVEQGPGGHARRIAAASRGSRPSSPMISSIVTPDAVRRAVTSSPGALHRKSEHVEAARDIGHGGRRNAWNRLDARTRSLADYFGTGTDASRSLRTYGPTAVTALVALADAQYALLVGGPRGGERLARAVDLDEKLHDRAFDDLTDATTGASVRGFAFATGQPLLVDTPNVLMLILEARLFRLTKTEDYRLEARALYAALQPLKLGDAPARYASVYAKALLGVDTANLTTLAGESYVAWALLFGDHR